MTLSRRGLVAASTLALAAPRAARAQAWPQRPVRIIVPFPPGGPNDIIARLYQPEIQRILGQSVVIENRAGAGGLVGTDAAVKAAPDGYTFACTNGGSLVISPHVTTVSYRVPEEVGLLSIVCRVPEALVASPKLGVRTFADLLALARREPNRLNIGTAGAAGISHLAAELFVAQTRSDIVVVPYRGAAPAVADTVAGNVKIVASGLPPVLAQARQGRLRIIAVTTPRRSPAIPDVPTLEEAGITGFDMSNAVGIVVPRGSPAEAIARLNAAANAALKEPEVRKVFLDNGAEPLGSTVEEHTAFVRREREHYREWIRLTGITMD